MQNPFIQSDFSGGMNLFNADEQIRDNEYGIAYNVRNRKTNLIPIKEPLEDLTADLMGKKQGVYAFDVFVLVFLNGQAYFKDIVNGSSWTKIVGFAMSSTANYLYAEVVPASRINFERRREDDQAEGNSTDTKMVLDPTIVINGTPSGLVVQDGINQPYIILPDGTARKTQTYDEWTKDAREYVPIMSQMKYFDGILFGIAPDGITIYRSVSGRPLDFVVNVTKEGDKGGNASTTAYSVSFDQITCLQTLSSGELFAATTKTCYPIELNYDKTIFGEPTFFNRKPFSAGVTNQFSFIDILGDYGFIDIDGIRSFNAVASQGNEGRNSIFSLRLASALEGIKQSVTAAAVFNNYSLFSLNTSYGSVIAVYDNTRQQWVCFDKFDGVDAIKMFAVANQAQNPSIFAITDTKIYQLYAGVSYSPSVTFKAYTTSTTSNELLLHDVGVILDKGSTVGTATLTEIVDGVDKANLIQPISATPILLDNVPFNFTEQATQGWSIQCRLSWSNDAIFKLIQATATIITRKVSLRQQELLHV